MSAITDLRRERRKRNRRRMIKTLLVVVVVIAAAAGSVLLYEKFKPSSGGSTILQQNEVNLPQNSGSDQTTGVSLTGGSPQNIYAMDGSIGVITDTNFLVYETSGKSATISYKHSFNHPQVVVNGAYALLYDAGGKKAVVLSKSKVVLEYTSEQPILSATVSERGWLGIATGATSFGAQFTVIDSTQTEIFKWYTSDYQILSVDFSPDQKGAAVGCIGAQDGQLISMLYIFDFNKKEPVSKTQVNDSMILQVRYQNNSAVFVVAEDQCFSVLVKGKESGKFMYGDHTPAMIARGNGDVQGIILRQHANNRITTLHLFDAQCNSVATISVSDVRDIYIDGNRVYVLSDRITCYDTQGNLIGVQTVSSGAQKIVAVSSNVYAMTLSAFEKVEIEKQNPSDTLSKS